MTPADEYRTLAIKLRAKASQEKDETLASEWRQLARSYLRLAEQAEQNTLADIWIEVGPKLALDREE